MFKATPCSDARRERRWQAGRGSQHAKWGEEEGRREGEGGDLINGSEGLGFRV